MCMLAHKIMFKLDKSAARDFHLFPNLSTDAENGVLAKWKKGCCGWVGIMAMQCVLCLSLSGLYRLILDFNSTSLSC